LLVLRSIQQTSLNCREQLAEFQRKNVPSFQMNQPGQKSSAVVRAMPRIRTSRARRPAFRASSFSSSSGESSSDGEPAPHRFDQFLQQHPLAQFPSANTSETLSLDHFSEEFVDSLPPTLSTEDAAVLLDLLPQTLLKQICEGRLPLEIMPKKHGIRWLWSSRKIVGYLEALK